MEAAAIFLGLILIDIILIVSFALFMKKFPFPQWVKQGLWGTVLLWPAGYILLLLFIGFLDNQNINYPKSAEMFIVSLNDLLPIPNLFGLIIILPIGFLLGSFIGFSYNKFGLKKIFIAIACIIAFIILLSWFILPLLGLS